MRSGKKMSPVSTHQGGRSSVEKEGVWAQDEMSRQRGLRSGRVWDGKPSLPALGCWPAPLQPHQHDWLQRAAASTLIYTGPSSSARRVEWAPLQSQAGAHNILSSQNCRSSPAHSMHLPRAGRGGKSLLTGLRCGYHHGKALQPHSPFLNSLGLGAALIASGTEGFFLNRVQVWRNLKQDHAEFFQEKPPQAAVLKQFEAL